MGIVHYKSELCKHPDTCFINAFKQALKSLKYGIGVEIVLNLGKILISLFKRKFKSHIKHLLTPEFQKLRIPLFFFVMTLVQKGAYCFLRYIRDKEDNYNPFLAGVLSGLAAINFLAKKHWYLILSLLSARIMDCLYKLAVDRGYLSASRHNLHFYLMFLFGNIINSYGFFVEPDIIGEEIYKLYDRMAVLDEREKLWLRSSFNYTKQQLQAKNRLFFNDIIQKKIEKLTPASFKKK